MVPGAGDSKMDTVRLQLNNIAFICIDNGGVLVETLPFDISSIIHMHMSVNKKARRILFHKRQKNPESIMGKVICIV